MLDRMKYVELNVSVSVCVIGKPANASMNELAENERGPNVRAAVVVGVGVRLCDGVGGRDGFSIGRMHTYVMCVFCCVGWA